MQSLTRQLKRGNAIIIFDNVFKRFESVSKRGTRASVLAYSQKLRSKEAEFNHIAAAGKPKVGKVGRKANWATPTYKKATV